MDDRTSNGTVCTVRVALRSLWPVPTPAPLQAPSTVQLLPLTYHWRPCLQFPMLPALSGVLLHIAVVWMAAYTVAPGLIHMEQQQAAQYAASSATASGGHNLSRGNSSGSSSGRYVGNSSHSALPAIGINFHVSCNELQRNAPLLLSCQPLWGKGVLAAAMIALPLLAALAAHLYYRAHYTQACALLLQRQGETQQEGARTPIAAAAAARRHPEGSSLLYRSPARRRAVAVMVSGWAAGNKYTYISSSMRFVVSYRVRVFI